MLWSLVEDSMCNKKWQVFLNLQFLVKSQKHFKIDLDKYFEIYKIKLKK